MTPEQYGAELDRLLAATQQLGKTGPPISELLKELPPAWQVQTREKKFEISTDGLARDFERLHQRFDPELQQSICEQLTGLRADLAAYEKAPSDISRQRAILAGIVARPEFHDLHGPSWSERLKQRFIEALLFFLRRFFSRIRDPDRRQNLGLQLARNRHARAGTLALPQPSTRGGDGAGGSSGSPGIRQGVDGLDVRGARSGAAGKLAGCDSSFVLGGHFFPGDGGNVAARSRPYAPRISSAAALRKRVSARIDRR